MMLLVFFFFVALATADFFPSFGPSSPCSGCPAQLCALARTIGQTEAPCPSGDVFDVMRWFKSDQTKQLAPADWRSLVERAVRGDVWHLDRQVRAYATRIDSCAFAERQPLLHGELLFMWPGNDSECTSKLQATFDSPRPAAFRCEAVKKSEKPLNVPAAKKLLQNDLLPRFFPGQLLAKLTLAQVVDYTCEYEAGSFLVSAMDGRYVVFDVADKGSIKRGTYYFVAQLTSGRELSLVVHKDNESQWVLEWARFLPSPAVAANTTGTSRAGKSVRVCSLNIWNFDDGDRWELRKTALATELAGVRPDVVFLQEVREAQARSNQMSDLHDAIRLVDPEYADSLAGALYFPLMYHGAVGSDEGIAVLTSLEIESHLKVDLPFVEELDANQRGVIGIELADMTLWGTHWSFQQGESQELQAFCTYALLNQIADGRCPAGSASFDASKPQVLVGDLNAYDAFTSPVEFLEGRKELYGHRGDFVDLFAGSGSTWPAWGPTDRLDRIYGRNGVKSSNQRLIGTSSQDGLWPSDHIGVCVDIAPES